MTTGWKRTVGSQDLKRAFEFLWEMQQKQQKEGNDIEGQTYYVTATSLERRLRCALEEEADGKKYGEYGDQSYGYKRRLNVKGLYGLPLFDLCRKWLCTQYHDKKLEMHNFSRGHISGARFRPVGSPLSPQEEAMMAKIKKEGPRGENKLVHLKDPEVKGWPAKTLCSRAARKAAKKRGYSRGSYRTSTRFSTEVEKVTCKRCLKLAKGRANGETEKAKGAEHAQG